MGRSHQVGRDEPSRPDPISIMIVMVASVNVILFFLPWLTVEAAMSGFDITSISSENWPQMDTFPNGVVFILPLVMLSVAYQYFRRWRSDKRPRRRATTVAMLAVGIIATIIWIRAYTITTTDYLNRQLDVLDPKNPHLPSFEVTDEGTLRTYSTGDILSEQFTVIMWLHLMLGFSMLILPWLDQRIPDDPPAY